MPTSAVWLHCAPIFLLLASKAPTQERPLSEEVRLRNALAKIEKEHGAEAIELADVLEALGLVVADKGDLPGAVTLFARALAVREKVVGRSHSSLMKSLYQLAATCHTMKDYGQAEEAYARALAIANTMTGFDPVDMATLCNNFGGLHFDRGAYDKAEPLLRQALAIHLQLGGPQNPEVATDRKNLAELLRLTNRSQEAAELERAAATGAVSNAPKEPKPGTPRQWGPPDDPPTRPLPPTNDKFPVWMLGAFAGLIGAVAAYVAKARAARSESPQEH